MSVWRRKAIECLPGLRQEFEQPENSIYQVFFAMVPALAKAHKEKDISTAKKIYDFAEWCLGQKKNELYNAVSVAFYEHLGDDEATLKEFPKWIKPEIYQEIRGLLDWRLPAAVIQDLDKIYGYKPNIKK